MRVASAPHFPAEPRALVGSDILQLLSSTNGPGEHPDTAVVRRFFTNIDASEFSRNPEQSSDLFLLEPELEKVLETLEARL